MSIPWQNLMIGAGLAMLISAIAWRAGSLSPAGVLAATVLGTVIFGLGGLGWAIVLLGFFISSSLLSRLFKRRKKNLDGKYSKSSRRDAAQVAANGGIAGLFVLLYFLLPGSAWAWAGFAGALAAANADTWATELGVMSRPVPRLITTGQIVERGASGGITVLGTLASTTGAMLIALLAVLFWQGQIAPLPLPGGLVWLAMITLAGLTGSLLDSLLGATLQSIYYCQACRKETERHPYHTCGARTTRRRGWSWLGNDSVNTFCTLGGALVALGAFALFPA